MLKFDFKKEDGKVVAIALAKEIFEDFDDVQTEFTEYGTMNITLDNVFEISFSSERDLVQTKKIITLLSLKKLENLTNAKHRGNETWKENVRPL